MKRHILLFAFLLCSAGRIGAQDSGSNWIKTRTAISETGTTITDITYYNGLGLPSQTTNVRASVNGYNIVTPIVYDALLRTRHIPVSSLDEALQHGFDVIAHISCLGERGGVRYDERHVHHMGQRLRKICFAHAGRPE